MNFDYENNNSEIDLIFNDNLEAKWKEIEERQLNKKKNEINKKNEDYSNLENKFKILKMDLNKLIHENDNEFENFVISKINDLELLKSEKNRKKNKPQKIGGQLNFINNSSKTFLKENKDNLNNKKVSLDDLLNNNDNQSYKVKETMNSIFSMINQGKESNIEEITNNNNIKNNDDLFNKDDTKSFLKKDDEKKEKKKKVNKEKIIVKEEKKEKKKRILNKIEENYKYLYKLYPNMLNKK